MDYELYHDESNESGYWHGLFLVPTNKKAIIINYLDSIRNNTGYTYKLGIKNIKNKGKIYNCARAWIHFGVVSLIQDLKGEKYPIYTELKYDDKYDLLEELLACKLIIFREKDGHEKMTDYPDHCAKVETTFRFAFKGGAHLLGSEKNPINITKIHFDGHEHYRRNINKDRIINRLNGLRNYVTISEKDNVIDDRQSNHNKEKSQTYEDCQLLQLTDLLVGSFRTILGKSTKKIHNEVAYPVNDIINKYNLGYARMKNSRWFNGFCVSECFLENENWVFRTIEKDSELKNKQLELFT